MARLIFTEEAKQDLLAIRNYTHKTWGKTQAQTYINELRHTLRQLIEHPLLGIDRSDDLGTAIRSLPQASHMIYYQLAQNDIVVLAILHQAMVPTKHL